MEPGFVRKSNLRIHTNIDENFEILSEISLVQSQSKEQYSFNESEH